jgi:hypothetical protein
VNRPWLTFVVVGAGPTGVELAGAIAKIARQTLKNDFRSIRPEESQVILLEGTPRVLLSFPDCERRSGSECTAETWNPPNSRSSSLRYSTAASCSAGLFF